MNEGVLDAVNKGQVSESDFIEWKPIGTYDSYDAVYTGTFDGQGHTISGLYFNHPDASYVGLFGYIGANGKISNVGVTDSYFKFRMKGGGGVCGKNDKDGVLQNCSNSSTVIGKNQYSRTGGVCGDNSGTVRDCKNTGSVSGENFVGGVCGINLGTIKNCYNTGSVHGTDVYVGGVCGNSYRVTNTNYCYYLSDTATRGIGNLMADEKDKAEKMFKEQFESGEVAWLLNGSTSTPAEGSNLSWYQKLGENGDEYPVLKTTGENTVYHGMTCNKKTDVYTNDNSIFGDDGAIPHEFKIADQPDANGLYGDVCVNCKENNESAKYINRFCEEDGRNIKLTVNPDGSYSTEETVTIADNAAYNSPVDFTAAKVVYTRNYLGADQWQAVYVPFEAKATDWTDNGITVASINNFHEYEKEDGSGYETVLEVKKATSGEFDANMPYVARTSGSDSGSKTITISNAKLHKAESKKYDCMSMTRKYDFIGIYTPQSGLGQDDPSVTVYALDKQGRIAPLKSETTLGAQRWYLTVSDRNGSSLPQNTKSRIIRIDMIGEGSTTGIKDVQVITSNEANNIAKAGIYDLQGRKLSKEPTQGIYIKNGKKYVK